jgi:hypothetical protein
MVEPDTGKFSNQPKQVPGRMRRFRARREDYLDVAALKIGHGDITHGQARNWRSKECFRDPSLLPPAGGGQACHSGVLVVRMIQAARSERCPAACGALLRPSMQA